MAEMVVQRYGGLQHPRVAGHWQIGQRASEGIAVATIAPAIRTSRIPTYRGA
jgi:hypothetical protein